MHSRKTCTAALLTAVKRASELTSHLVLHPFDFTVLTPLIKSAKAIGDCARALRQRELLLLSRKLIDASQMDLTKKAGVTELCTTMARVIAIVEEFGDLESTVGPAATELEEPDADDPFSSLTGTTWVVL